jgi:hypothetical protein
MRDITPIGDAAQASNSVTTSSGSNQAARILVTYCTFCRTEIPEARQRLGSRTCSQDCQKEYRRRYFKDRHRRVCRVCGRRIRKRSKDTQASRPG